VEQPHERGGERTGRELAPVTEGVPRGGGDPADGQAEAEEADETEIGSELELE
jgi:hypothetical protein